MSTLLETEALPERQQTIRPLEPRYRQIDCPPTFAVKFGAVIHRLGPIDEHLRRVKLVDHHRKPAALTASSCPCPRRERPCRPPP